MNRLRALMVLTVLAITTIGVQAVHAYCPIAYRLYYESGTETCRLFNIYEGRCQYICKWVSGPIPT